MPTRKATAVWEGNLKTGKGKMRFAEYEGPFTFASRFETGRGTNPEELLGAAHAGCFAMALSNELSKAGHVPCKTEVTAHVTLGSVDGKARITTIHLVCRVDVPAIIDADFQAIAERTKQECPVSAALTGVEITLDAQLMR